MDAKCSMSSRLRRRTHPSQTIIAAMARERTEGLTMNNLDVAGILTTYSLKAKGTKNTEDLRDLIRDLKQELDLRKVRVEDG